MKFGIYTSFYNNERFIERIFQNIERINYEDFEWHITDDFSTDNTKELLLNRIELSPIKDKIKFFGEFLIVLNSFAKVVLYNSI